MRISEPNGVSHQDGIADTGQSHYKVGRQYVIQCMWCPSVYYGKTKDEAMRMFRIHELESQK